MTINDGSSLPTALGATSSRRGAILSVLGGSALAGLSLATEAEAKKKKKKKTDPSWKPAASIGNTGDQAHRLDGPNKVVLSSNGLELFVADTNNDRIAIFNRHQGSSEWMWSGSIGSGGSADDQFELPTGLAISANGRELFVADYSSSRISIWSRESLSGSWSHRTNLGAFCLICSEGFNSPNSVTLAPNQLELYVADYVMNKIIVWKRTDINSQWVPSTSFGSSGSENDQFSSPESSAISPDGSKLYVADYSNNRVTIWTRSGQNWVYSDVIGGVNGPCQPSITSDGSRIFIPEYGANLVKIWSFMTDHWDVEGTVPGPTPPSLENQLNGPYGTALSADGKTLYIADYVNNRIAVWKYS